MKNMHPPVYIKLFELTIKTYCKYARTKNWILKLKFKFSNAQKQYHFQPDEFYCRVRCF